MKIQNFTHFSCAPTSFFSAFKVNLGVKTFNLDLPIRKYLSLIFYTEKSQTDNYCEKFPDFHLNIYKVEGKISLGFNKPWKDSLHDVHIDRSLHVDRVLSGEFP